MDEIKQSFQRVKQDIFCLGEEIQNFKFEIQELRNEIKLISGYIQDLKLEKIKQTTNITPTTPTHIPTHISKIPTHHPPIQPSEPQNLAISTGNQGVPTDRQTNQQTDRHIIQHIKTPENPIKKASEILENLDALKKQIRIKFKRLTTQEIVVFSLLYDLENKGFQVDYPLLSSRLNLSESSVRDYIGKIQRKGIPVTKEKLNNKKIILHISPEIKKIASLDTILKLREL